MSVVVAGLGVMGAHTLLHLARSGIECVGVEQHDVPHEHGASGGGATRIFRSGWDDAETRRLEYARGVWEGLNLDGEGVFIPCGALTVGRASDSRMSGPLDFAHRAPSRFTVLGAGEAQERWPRLLLEPDELVVLDLRGGLLRAGAGVAAAVAQAEALGARVITHASVTHLRCSADGIEVATSRGPLNAERAVVTVGHVPGSLVSAPVAGWPTLHSRRVVLAWKPSDGTDDGVGHPPPGLRLLRDDASISFFPPVDGWGPKFNYIPADRPLAGALAHPGIHPSDVRTLDEHASSTIASTGSGVSRLESYVEHFVEVGASPFVVSGTRLAWASGFSGVGYRLAPWVGRELAGISPGPAA